MTLLKEVWITSAALTTGIIRVENVERCDDINPDMISFTNRHGYKQQNHKPDWHYSLADALVRAKTMQIKKIESLEKQLAKMLTLKFKIIRGVVLALSSSLIGCASGARTWPEVVDHHILVSAFVVCFLAYVVAWIIRGAPKIAIDAKDADR